MNISARTKLLAILAISVIGAIVLLTQRSFAANPPNANPVTQLQTRVKALENATVEVSYGTCRMSPTGTFFDPKNADAGPGRFGGFQCNDGEALLAFSTGVNNPNAEVRFRCCKIKTKIVPHP